MNDIWKRQQEAEQEDQELLSLRPNYFKEFIGQQKTINNLKVTCYAAKKRKEAMDHILLHGPPGLGKTSLAKIIANELGVNFKASGGPVLEKPGDLAAILTSLEKNDVFFIDEIHRLPRAVEEVLYPAMEDFEIDILLGQGAAAKSVKIELKPFTLIGATTRTGSLSSPLRDRFGLLQRMELYSNEDLAKVIVRSADLLKIRISQSAALILGKCSRGTPRIANRLLKRVRDYAQDKNNEIIDNEIAEYTLKALDIDEFGLDTMDRIILNTIKNNFAGGPVGIETLAAAVGEEKHTIEDVYEPYLLQKGYLERTTRGRKITDLAYNTL